MRRLPITAGVVDLMNLRSIDLNLLVVLDALIEERHVSRAAKRLGLSQPATSNALDRLRHRLGDPLLERHGRQMRLTPRSEALRAPLRRALLDLGALVGGAAPTAPGDLRQRVRLVLADAIAAAALPPLYAALQATAPGVELAVLPWSDAASIPERLARDDIDLAAVAPLDATESLRRERLLQFDSLVAMRRDHPAAAGFGLEAWLAWPHLLVSGDGARQDALDPLLAAAGLERRVAMVVPGFLMVPHILAETDLLALLPAACLARPDAHPELTAFAPPLALPDREIHLAWHPRRDGDPAVALVRRLLTRALEDAGTTCSLPGAPPFRDRGTRGSELAHAA